MPAPASTAVRQRPPVASSRTYRVLGERFDSRVRPGLRAAPRPDAQGLADPYVGHLLGVTSIVIENGGSEDEAIAALLHDSAEDQGGLRDAASGSGTSSATRWRASSRSAATPGRAQAAVAGAKGGVPGAARARPPRPRSTSRSPTRSTTCARSCSTTARSASALWARFNAGRDEVLWYYRSLAEVLAGAFPGRLPPSWPKSMAELERLMAARRRAARINPRCGGAMRWCWRSSARRSRRSEASPVDPLPRARTARRPDLRYGSPLPGAQDLRAPPAIWFESLEHATARLQCSLRRGQVAQVLLAVPELAARPRAPHVQGARSGPSGVGGRPAKRRFRVLRRAGDVWPLGARGPKLRRGAVWAIRTPRGRRWWSARSTATSTRGTRSCAPQAPLPQPERGRAVGREDGQPGRGPGRPAIERPRRRPEPELLLSLERGGPPSSGEYPGPRPFSEPESRAVRRLVKRVRPRVTIWYHQPWGQVLLPCHGPAQAQRRYARIAHLPTKRCRGQRLPGTATRWQNHRCRGPPSWSSCRRESFPTATRGGTLARREGGGVARQSTARTARPNLQQRRRFESKLGRPRIDRDPIPYGEEAQAPDGRLLETPLRKAPVAASQPPGDRPPLHARLDLQVRLGDVRLQRAKHG